MRSIAEQTVAELGGRASVLTRQRRDHQRLERLLLQVEGTTGPDQDVVLRRIWRLVYPHAYGEETILWPALRKASPSGDDQTLRVEQEHQEINELSNAIERSQAGSTERQELLDRLVVLLRQDVRDEEDDLLATLQQQLNRRQLQRLGVAWEIVRRTAPTRPHSVVSRRPPGNVLAALPLTVLDRFRDVAEAGARRSSGRVATTLTAASAGAARVAGAVERLSLLRRGEHSSTKAGRTPVHPAV